MSSQYSIWLIYMACFSNIELPQVVIYISILLTWPRNITTQRKIKTQAHTDSHISHFNFRKSEYCFIAKIKHQSQGSAAGTRLLSSSTVNIQAHVQKYRIHFGHATQLHKNNRKTWDFFRLQKQRKWHLLGLEQPPLHTKTHSWGTWVTTNTPTIASISTTEIIKSFQHCGTNGNSQSKCHQSRGVI